MRHFSNFKKAYSIALSKRRRNMGYYEWEKRRNKLLSTMIRNYDLLRNLHIDTSAKNPCKLCGIELFEGDIQLCRYCKEIQIKYNKIVSLIQKFTEENSVPSFFTH